MREILPYVGPVVALICGLLILIRPALCPTIVAIYLIVAGILGLVSGHPAAHAVTP